MNKISVVMYTYNAEKHVREAIDSVLHQSFTDFELIIVDDGSTDNTLPTICSYNDKRIRLIENKHDFVDSLNKGLNSASGRYIARMDANSIMHIDRLKIQHTIMEEDPTITVCSSWIYPFGEGVPKGAIAQTSFGLLQQPLLHLLKGNIIFHPTVMIQHAFLKTYNLKYENYKYAEDYKLWLEIAKKKGIFYVESQPLLMYRVANNQKRDSQIEASVKIKKEILDYLLDINNKKHIICKSIYTSMKQAQKKGLITNDDIFGFFFTLFTKNKNSLIVD